MMAGTRVLAAMICVLWGCGDNDPAGSRDAAPPGDEDAASPEDLTPPADVTGLTATANGASVDLAWTNPSDDDLAGVVIVRRLVDPVIGAPSRGVTYDAGDSLQDGDIVVFAGAGESFQDDSAPPGFVHYAAFARDEAANWSSTPPRADLLLAIPVQRATLSVAVATPAVTVTVPPPHYGLTGTATYDAGTDTLTVTITAQSGIARNVFSPKIVVTSVGQGALTGDGTFDGDPFVRLGSGLAPGAQADAELTITGVDGTVDPVLIDVQIVDHPMAVLFGRHDNQVAYERVDTGTLTSMGTVDCDSLRYVDPGGTGAEGKCAPRPGAVSRDGRRLFTGHRSLPIVRSIDLATNTLVAMVQLDAGIGGVRMVVLDPTATTLYALLTLRGHSYWGDVNGEVGADEDHVLVRLDATSLTETGRVIVADDVAASTMRLADVAVSPDGSRIAVTSRGNGLVHLFDAATLTPIDTDAATDGVQPVNISDDLGFDIKHVVFDADSSRIIVQGSNGTRLVSIDASTFAITTITLPGAATETGALTRGPDGNIYATFRPSPDDGLARVEGGGAVTADTGGVRPRAIGVTANRVFMALETSELAVFDTTTLAAVAGSGAPITLEPGHVIVFTPF